MRADREVEAVGDEVANQINEMADQAVTDLWEIHRQNTAAAKRKFNTNNPGNEENSNPQTEPIGSSAMKPVIKSEKGVAQEPSVAPTLNGSSEKDKNFLPTQIHVQITTGEYAGSSYTLKPTTRWPCFVGRSTGKKFTGRGISLPKDLEVSTSHGKFEVGRGSKLRFIDTGSTNGTLVDGELLEAQSPIELYDGMEITVGMSLMKVKLS